MYSAACKILSVCLRTDSGRRRGYKTSFAYLKVKEYADETLYLQYMTSPSGLSFKVNSTMRPLPCDLFHVTGKEAWELCANTLQARNKENLHLRSQDFDEVKDILDVIGPLLPLVRCLFASHVDLSFGGDFWGQVWEGRMRSSIADLLEEGPARLLEQLLTENSKLPLNTDLSRSPESN